MSILTLFVVIPVVMLLGLWLARNDNQVRGVMVCGASALLALAIYLTVAFIQQRSKIKPEAFEELFRSFNRANQQIQLFHGYRLLAIDGSLLHTPTNKMDTDSLHYNRTSCFNLYNINAFYDLNNHTYTDVLIQKFKQRNEHAAFVHMVDNLDSSVPALITADRGYESYNNLAHVQESGHKFLIRMKDKNSNGILQRFELPDGEFDLPIHLTLTRKHTNDLKSDPSVICIGNSTKLDFLPNSCKKTDPTVFYSLDFRIVRVKISDDCYEILATNLDEKEFPPSFLKEIYAMRWGIETSFRKLKYTVGLTALHSKKSEHILQEIFARLIMYNFSELVTSRIAIRKKKRKKENTFTGSTFLSLFTRAAIFCLADMLLKTWKP